MTASTTAMVRNSTLFLAVALSVALFGVSGARNALAQGASSAEQPSIAREASAAAQTSTKSKAKARRVGQGTSAGHVYLLRGLLNIFSFGMDDLAAKIQARGIGASVYNHAEWQTIADEITAKYKAGQHGPIVLVGHSLGADAVMFMAEYLGKKGVPVALVVPFDGTGSFAASSNVARVMNLTQRDYAYMRRGSGFRGELSNIDVSNQAGIDHINIDKSARLHAMVLAKIQGVIGRGRSQTAGEGTPAPRMRPASANHGAPAAAETAPATTASTSGPALTAEPAVQKPAEPSDASATTRAP